MWRDKLEIKRGGFWLRVGVRVRYDENLFYSIEVVKV